LILSSQVYSFHNYLGENMEALQLQPIDNQLNGQNSVGAADTLTPVDSNAAGNASVGSSIQDTQLGQSLAAALDAPAAPAAPAAPVAPAEPAAPVVIAEPSAQAAAQEVQALNQEQAPSQAQANAANTPVGDSADPAAVNSTAVANSLKLTAAGSVEDALSGAVTGLDPTTLTDPLADHDHANPGTAPEFHASADDIASGKGLNAGATRLVRNLTRRFGIKGDFLDPGAGTNTVIGAGGNDLIFGNGKGFNTITTGTGNDAIVLGDETTNRIFDFNPNRDRFVISDDLDINNIVITQGKNPGKGGLNQPLDSLNNTLIIDKSDGHILASLTFVKSDAITEKNFFKVGANSLDAVKKAEFGNVQQGDGQLNGTQGHDKLIGGDGNDFLAPGDDTFTFRTARSGAEFPFVTNSPGSTKLNLELKGGVFRVNGTYENFDGAPLFSQGETTIDPKAIVLNDPTGGNDPIFAQKFIDGFLKVPEDVEGNKISGTHFHFSPAEDVRGNFADATVVRYFTNTPTDAKSGTISGEFELTPDEQAALLAGNLYANTHTNVDLDGDGKGGFPTGENRTNFNKNVVQFV
jgi:Ca2+-binding RTX toxin-like protein